MSPRLDSQRGATVYELHLTCRRCGSGLEPQAVGKPIDAGQSIRATCECPECGVRWLLTAEMHPTDLPPWVGSYWGMRNAEKRANERTRVFAESVGIFSDLSPASAPLSTGVTAVFSGESTAFGSGDPQTTQRKLHA